MKIPGCHILGLLLLTATSYAQDTFVITGTAIPDELVKLNYGSVPKGIRAFDLDICNVTSDKQSVVSSAIYQALAQANAGLQPIGRAIMLAVILRNQNHSLASILNLVLNSATGVLSVVGAAKTAGSAGWRRVGVAVGTATNYELEAGSHRGSGREIRESGS